MLKSGEIWLLSELLRRIGAPRNIIEAFVGIAGDDFASQR